MPLLILRDKVPRPPAIFREFDFRFFRVGCRCQSQSQKKRTEEPQRAQRDAEGRRERNYAWLRSAVPAVRMAWWVQLASVHAPSFPPLRFSASSAVLSLVGIGLRSICAVIIHNSFDSILEHYFVKVDQQADAQVQDSQMRD